MTTPKGLKDAPRAFGMRLSRSRKEIGHHQGVTSTGMAQVQQECWTSSLEQMWLPFKHGRHYRHGQ
eukprot:12934114-Prorocentrum_lima.AAC.1